MVGAEHPVRRPGGRRRLLDRPRIRHPGLELHGAGQDAVDVEDGRAPDQRGIAGRVVALSSRKPQRARSYSGQVLWRRRKPTQLGDVAGSAYAAFLVQQLQDESLARDSLERRGLAVISTSGTLVTLVFAFATFLA